MNTDSDSLSSKPYTYESVSQKNDRPESRVMETWRQGSFHLFCSCCSFATPPFCIYVSHLCFLVIPIVIPFALYVSVLSFSFHFHRPNEGLETHAGPVPHVLHNWKKRSAEIVPIKIINANLVPSWFHPCSLLLNIPPNSDFLLFDAVCHCFSGANRSDLRVS